jgi:hypothetical protein
MHAQFDATELILLPVTFQPVWDARVKILQPRFA